MKKIEKNQHWLLLDVLCGKIKVLRNQNIQLQMESDDTGDSNVDLSRHEAKQISNMLLVAIGELDESVLEEEKEG